MDKPTATDLIIDAISNGNNNPIQRDRCNICNKRVLDNQKNVSCQCNQCKNWTHNKCDDITNLNEFKAQCLKCSITFNYRNIPFTLCNNMELSNTNECNSSKFLNSLPSFEIISEASKFSQPQSNDVDLNLAFQNDCSYYSVNEISKLNLNNNLNIFHTNINGLESKFDNLHEFLSSTYSKMDIIAITEGYENYNTPSYSSKGGTAIYVNKKFNIIERKDLNAQNEDNESVWVEIKNKFSKNIVTGCIYRHPRYNLKEFMCYLENCLMKLTKENKEIYLCSDFNIDLLKIEINQNYHQFYNMLCSFGFLPKIIQPTRVTDHHSTFLSICINKKREDRI